MLNYLFNISASKDRYQNDLGDFRMPYIIYGTTDYEVMKEKYLKLHNYSYGYVVRSIHVKNAY